MPTFGAVQFEFLLWGALWTLALSAIACIGGGLLGFAVAMAPPPLDPAVLCPAALPAALPATGSPLLVEQLVHPRYDGAGHAEIDASRHPPAAAPADQLVDPLLVLEEELADDHERLVEKHLMLAAFGEHGQRLAEKRCQIHGAQLLVQRLPDELPDLLVLQGFEDVGATYFVYTL